jgi:hypothetical protein
MINNLKEFTSEQQDFLSKHMNHRIAHDFMGCFCITCDKELTDEVLKLGLDWR